jgi:general secretion pathway protein C
VTLKSVDFDSVTISRGGADEQLFMDQSETPNTVAPPPAATPAVPTEPVIQPSTSVEPGSRPVPPSRPQPTEVSAVPRMNGTELTGVTVRPRGSGEGFRALGLAPGDVVLSVNGRRIRSAEQAQGMAAQLASARVILQVERDGRVMTLRPGAAR